jgi:hypothetical protein
MVKRTFSQQKINLPNEDGGKWKVSEGKQHSSCEKTFSFWESNTGKSYHNRFCTDFSSNKTIAAQLPSLKCQLYVRCPDIETPKKKEWFQGHCMLEK